VTQDHATSSAGVSAIESLFDTTVRGFNKKQVEEYLGLMRSELATKNDDLAALQAQVDERSRELNQVREEITSLRSETSAANRPQHEEVSERLAQILRLADEEADQKRAKAAQEAETALEQARDQSAKVLEAARSAAEGIISAARERAEKEAAAAKAEAEALLANAASSSQATIEDAEQRAAQVLSDADQRTSQITSLQDERLAALREVHTDTLRRLEAVRGVLEKVLIAEADAGPPHSGISNAPLPAAGVALRAADVEVTTAAAGFAAADGAFDGQIDDLDAEPPTAADFADDAVEFVEADDEELVEGDAQAAELAEADESAVRR
jgi:cell division septum initiation protein DivIVA